MEKLQENKSKVVLIPVESYENRTAILDALRRGLQLLGGPEAFFEKEERILLKPNLLKTAVPEQAITTHPAVFWAMGKLLLEAGYTNLVYGDSGALPIGGSQTAAASGLAAESEALGIPFGSFEESVTVPDPRSENGDTFVLCKEVTEADAILSLCKMKTHALERITGAVKNTYGCIFKHYKAMGHSKFPNETVFAKMLVRLNLYLKPRLYLMDGIVAMEGNGPSSGDPVEMKVLLLSADPVAMDSVQAALMYLDPELVPTNLCGAEGGLGVYRWDSIDVLVPGGAKSGESGTASVNGPAFETLTPAQAAERYGKRDFNVYRDPEPKNSHRWLALVEKVSRRKPVVAKERCIGCGICVKSCPLTGKAILLEEKNGKKYPRYHYDQCIRCFCCQEVCPQKAIDARKPLLRKLVERVW
ncbi:MAG: DUF362 domain-containing protein [Firmicutes bacterium]|nr:DUF362 domain-containing protein [Bacillota bacterium]